VVAAGVVSWIGAALVAWNAWRVGFQHGHTRIEAASAVYLVLALLSTALVALPFTFLQWVDPGSKERWRSAGGAIGLVGCAIFLLLWLTG
jgi:drug/metabolite transporter superfamily protein YnfA